MVWKFFTKSVTVLKNIFKFAWIFAGETVQEALDRLDPDVGGFLSDSCIEAVTTLLLPPPLSEPDGHIFVDAKCHISRLIEKHKKNAQRGEKGTVTEKKVTVTDFRNDCIQQIFGRHPARGRVPLTTGEIKELWPKVKCLLIPICTRNHWV